MKRRRLARPIGNFNKTANQGCSLTPSVVAKLAMQAERSLTPLICKEHMGSCQALIMIAMHTCSLIAGEKVPLSMPRIAHWCAYVLSCWKHGLFAPSKEFPYTFEQMFETSEGDLVDFAKPDEYFYEMARVWEKRKSRISQMATA